MDRKTATVRFVRDEDVVNFEEEPCDECSATLLCKLRDRLVKARVIHHATFVEECDLEL